MNGGVTLCSQVFPNTNATFQHSATWNETFVDFNLVWLPINVLKIMKNINSIHRIISFYVEATYTYYNAINVIRSYLLGLLAYCVSLLWNSYILYIYTLYNILYKCVNLDFFELQTSWTSRNFCGALMNVQVWWANIWAVEPGEWTLYHVVSLLILALFALVWTITLLIAAVGNINIYQISAKISNYSPKHPILFMFSQRTWA